MNRFTTAPLMRWESALLLLLVAEIMLFGMVNPRMWNIDTLLYSTSDFITLGIIALPLTLVIVSGGIDISFGAIVGLCAIVLGILCQNALPLLFALPLTLLVGLACGLFNAALILFTGVSPLVITLGTLYLFGGSALLLSGIAGATGFEGISSFPSALTDFVNTDVMTLPVPLLFFLIALLFFTVLMHRTRTGRNMFLMGQNLRVAQYGALPIRRTTFILYGMTGLSSAMAAVLMTAYFGSARADLGSSLLMSVITAAVLGGANIYGGAGSVIGTAIATLLIGYLQQGLQMAGISSQVSSALSGALLILVVIGRSVSLNRNALRSVFRRYRLRWSASSSLTSK